MAVAFTCSCWLSVIRSSVLNFSHISVISSVCCHTSWGECWGSCKRLGRSWAETAKRRGVLVSRWGNAATDSERFAVPSGDKKVQLTKESLDWQNRSFQKEPNLAPGSFQKNKPGGPETIKRWRPRAAAGFALLHTLGSCCGSWSPWGPWLPKEPQYSQSRTWHN